MSRKQTLERLLINDDRAEELPDCTACRQANAAECAICYGCWHFFWLKCPCVVAATVQPVREDTRGRGPFRVVRSRVRCVACEAALQPIYALERQKYVVAITPAAADEISPHEAVARAFLPLKLSALVLSGNLAGFGRNTHARDDFDGTDLELIKATFGCVTLTCGMIANGTIYHATRPYTLEFDFGTVLRYDGRARTVERNDAAKMAALFNDYIAEHPTSAMREMFKLLLHRIASSARHLVDPSSLNIVSRISTYASCSDNC